jgi:sugar phosphate isomerase/epimerase
MSLTIDTAHLAAAEYVVEGKWEEIKACVKGDINDVISHFHFVDYLPESDFDAAPPGEGVIGIAPFRRIVDDLYQLQYQGTISLEVAPLFFHANKLKMLGSIALRAVFGSAGNLHQEEEHIRKMFESLL